MALDSSTVALIGIGVAFGISLLTAIVFLILYARLKIKDDTNIRRRVIAAAPMEAKTSLIAAREPEMMEEFVETLPPPPPPPAIVYPAPIPVPAPPRPPPPQQQIFVIEPTPQPPPQPLPPPPPREPEVVIHEVIHRYEPAPAPPPPPQERVVRRRSWAALQEPEDDWVLVKKITKSSGKKATKVRDESSDESSDEQETRVKRRHHKKRLDRYDLATSVLPMGFRPQPQIFQSGGYMMAQPAAMMAQPAAMMAQPAAMMAPTALMAQPMMAAAQPTYMPFFTVPR